LLKALLVFLKCWKQTARSRLRVLAFSQKSTSGS